MAEVGGLNPKGVNAASVVSLRIYPPLGIARVGNHASSTSASEDDFLVTTETIGGRVTLPTGAPARTAADFRGPDGAIKRCAARFRIYADLRDGTVAELTLDNVAGIEWRASLANLKAGWYEFNQAMDLPASFAKDAARRNAALPLPDQGRRAMLDIVPTPRRITGRSVSGASYQFADGLFCGSPVYLGELCTDRAGRLLVLGGRGVSESFPAKRRPITFANNEGWHDDVSDGPVRATVRFADGSSLEAEPSYVAVTPPNFAPGLTGLITMDDAVREVFIARGWLKRPAATSFTADVYPVFARMTGLQWVNHGLFVLHGHGGPLDADDPEIMAKLREPGAAGVAWRRDAFALFRTQADGLAEDKGALPEIYGDATGEEGLEWPCLPVTTSQYAHLERWAAGQFVDDWPGVPPAAPEFASLAPADQVSHLERAALHDCLGGPFHPGIELTWTMRIPHAWSGPYRLKVLDGDGPARQDWGDVLTPAVCTGPGGPYDGIATGALTRFLGVPWQTDGASCNSQADYRPSYFLSMPTFWGARVPDQVMSAESFVRVSANAQTRKATQALKHFSTRVDWLRDVRGQGYFDRIAHMVAEWQKLGMVIAADGDPRFSPHDAGGAGPRIRRGARRPQAEARRGGRGPRRRRSRSWDAPGYEANSGCGRTTARQAAPKLPTGRDLSRSSNERLIVVAGAGPAGSTLARLLCLKGRRVVLVDGGARTHGRLELVAPRTAGLFLAAGLTDVLDDPAVSRPCHGIRRTWDGVASENDFLAEPLGWGRTVDRTRLDAVLLRLAEREGATIARGRVSAVAALGGGVVVQLTGGRNIEGAFVADATGRAAAVSRRLGARRLFAERLVATRESWPRMMEDRLFVEGSADDWRYSLFGPGGRADAWRISRPSRLRRGPGLAVDASPSRLDAFAGERWLAIGDASVAFDPIASQGLGHAMAGAMTAAGKLLGSCRMSGEDRDAFALLNLQTWATHRRDDVGRGHSSGTLSEASPARASAVR